ncbi:MAG: hypothetical protein GXP26_08400 [Planctomycetes bacterium]|nr:hypothetical protein [Planctomycetota bacterium]
MVIPLRTDSQAPGEQSIRRRPILLARLPHVGEPAAMDEATPTLAIANEQPIFAPPSHQKTTTSYFVDPGHLQQQAATPPAAEPPVSHQQAAPPSSPPKKRKRRSKTSSSQSTKSFASRAQPTGFAKIHAYTAPFAGAIVALALVTAAGLIYGMIFSPSQSSTDFHEIANDDWDASSEEIPPFAPSTFTLPNPRTTDTAKPLSEQSETSAESPTVFLEPLQVTPVETPPAQIPPEIVSAPKQFETPVPAEPTEEVAAYPTTNHSTALDFSQVIALGQGGLLEQPMAPSVADRPNTQTATPRH